MPGDSYLPPVVISVVLNDEEAIGGLDALDAKLDETAASAAASSDEIAASVDKSGASMAGMADASAASAGVVAEEQGKAADATTAAADDVHDASGSMVDDLGAAGAGAAAAGAKTGDALDETGSKAGSTAEDFHDATGSMAVDTDALAASVLAGHTDINDAMSKLDDPSAYDKAKIANSDLKDSNKGLGASYQKLGLVASVAVAGLAVESVKSYAKLETATAGLDTSIKNVGGSVSASKGVISNAISTQETYGHTAIETSEALAILTTATKSPTIATEKMGFVANYAARQHVGLAEAAAKVAKIYSGTPGRILKELGASGNVNLGTGKASSVVTAEQAVIAAQKAKQLVEVEAHAGKLSGTEATLKQAEASEKLAHAEEKLKNDQAEIPTVVKLIEGAYKGEAAKQAKTTAGELKVLHAHLESIEDSIGKGLIPVLKTAATVLASFVGWLVKGSVPAKALAVLIGGVLVGAIVAYGVHLAVAAGEQLSFAAEGIASAATWAASQVASFAGVIASMAVYVATTVASAATAAASWLAEGAAALTGGTMTAAGIALATAGIILIVIAVVELVKHWRVVWATIKAVLADAVGFIKQHIVAILAVIALPIAVLLEVYKHWKEIWGWFSGAVSAAWGAIVSAVEGGVNATVGIFESLPGKVMGVLSSMIKDMEKFGENLVKALISGIEHAPGDVAKALLKDIPGASGAVKDIGSVAHVLGLAEGGIVTKPTLAVVGEAGDEAVIPLKGIHARGDGVKALPGVGLVGSAASSASTSSSYSGGSESSGSSGGLHVGTVNVYGAKTPDSQLVNLLYQKLRPMLQGA